MDEKKYKSWLVVHDLIQEDGEPVTDIIIRFEGLWNGYISLFEHVLSHHVHDVL